jgi:hypothetical protein
MPFLQLSGHDDLLGMLLFNNPFSLLSPSANQEGDCSVPEQRRSLGRESEEVAGEYTPHFCPFWERKQGTDDYMHVMLHGSRWSA